MRVDEGIWPYCADLCAAKRNNIALHVYRTCRGEGGEKGEDFYMISNIWKGKVFILSWAPLSEQPLFGPALGASKQEPLDNNNKIIKFMWLFALAYNEAHWKTGMCDNSCYWDGGTKAQKNLSLLISWQPQHHQVLGWMFSSPLLVFNFLS